MIKDIKVVDTLKKLQDDEKWWNEPHSAIEFFAEAVSLTRDEKTGVSIKDISRCFKAQFDKAEIESLIDELTTK